MHPIKDSFKSDEIPRNLYRKKGIKNVRKCTALTILSTRLNPSKTKKIYDKKIQKKYKNENCTEKTNEPEKTHPIKDYFKSP